MANTTTWTFDPAHSELTFKAKHLMTSNVKGEFKKFNVSLESNGADFNDAKTKVTIDASSITTNNEDRDNHLKSADFFNAEEFNNIIFESSSFQMKDAENGIVKGVLTIKGVSKEINFDVEFGGTSKDPWGNEKVGFSLNGKFNRNDFGLTWNAALETGGVLVSEEVKFNAEVQFVKSSN